MTGDLSWVRAEPVGSLLRPEYLLRTREAVAGSRAGAETLKAAEDRAVRGAVALQEEAGLDVVTDGEMRRASFQSQMTEAVEGFGEPGLEAFTWGDWRGDGGVGDAAVERPEGLAVRRELRRIRPLSAEEFVYLRSLSDRVGKVTLPSPGLFANFWSPRESTEAYPRLGDFLQDVAGILEEEVRELARLGCRYVQIDAPHYPLLLEEETAGFYEERGWDRERWLREGPELENRVMAAAPELTFGLHLCRGNQDSRWLVSGGYDSIASLFGRTDADRLLLEYDDERSGGFGPLGEVPGGKTVVLGLVSTKRRRRETVEEIRRGVERAAGELPLDRLALSPQCGFATSVLGNRVSPEDQAYKLGVVARAARTIWG